MKINHMLKNGHSFLFGMLGAVMILILSHFFMAPKPIIGTVNITGLVDSFIKTERAKNLTPDSLQQEVKAFGQHLEHELKWISSKNHVVLLPSEAVIAGSQDYTAIVKERLHQTR